MTTEVSGLRSEVTRVVRGMIASIKEIDPALIDDETPLFRDGARELHAVELDSLDALDLSLELKERFDREGDVLDSLFRDNPDPAVFGTVNRIVDFILSALPAVYQGPSLTDQINPVPSQRGITK